MSNALDTFLSLSLEELFYWINISIKNSLSGGYDMTISKATLEQELLHWIETNGHEDEVWSYFDKF